MLLWQGGLDSISCGDPLQPLILCDSVDTTFSSEITQSILELCATACRAKDIEAFIVGFENQKTEVFLIHSCVLWGFFIALVGLVLSCFYFRGQNKHQTVPDSWKRDKTLMKNPDGL